MTDNLAGTNDGRPAPQFFPKDFVETSEGLVFAVVAGELEEGRVLCGLRYVRDGQGWRKCATDEADALLQAEYPQYRYYSRQRDVALHGVPLAAVVRHLQPRLRLRQLLEVAPQEAVQADLQALCGLLAQAGLPLAPFGVTGSLLIGAQHPDSDLDLVLYRRDVFHATRAAVRQWQADGVLPEFSQDEWQAAYARRGCELTLDEYIWHERRKCNKGLINGRKFDLGLINEDPPAAQQACRKLGRLTLRARVSDAEHAYDYPAVLRLDHAEISRCLSYTMTYCGQAEAGEWVEICGSVEQCTSGEKHLVVGASREARGEYVKVLHD